MLHFMDVLVIFSFKKRLIDMFLEKTDLEVSVRRERVGNFLFYDLAFFRKTDFGAKNLDLPWVYPGFTLLLPW